MGQDGAGDARSGRPPDVAMVQPTDFGNLDDLAELPRLDWPAVGCLVVEREVSSRPVIVREVASQDAAQVPFAKDEDKIQTLAPDRADEPLREGVLPGAGGRRQNLTDPHAPHSLPERVAVDRVAIAEEIGRGGVVREGIDDLLGPRDRLGLAVGRQRARAWRALERVDEADALAVLAERWDHLLGEQPQARAPVFEGHRAVEPEREDAGAEDRSE